MTLTPAIREFLVELDELVDSHAWPQLDREVVTVTPGREAVLIVLPHRTDGRLTIELHLEDREFVVNYANEHQHFSDKAEALRFVEMLGDGRVTLVVQRRLCWNRMVSYRDELAQPFAKTWEPWFNIRPRTETFRFGFAA